MKTAFYITVDDRYSGIGLAQARRLRRLWRVDVHVFIEGTGGAERDRQGRDGVFVHRNLTREMIPDNLPATSNWPRIVYGRIFVPFLLTEYDRLVYLDADVFPLVAAPELFQIALPDGLGAVEDTASISAPPALAQMSVDAWRASIGLHCGRYFNSGMLLIDPVIWRRTDYAAALSDYMAQYGAGVRMPDQDFLNAHFQGRWTALSPRFNFQKALYNYGYERLLPPVFLHFSSFQKPWLKPDHPDSVHGQFFPVYQEMFAQAGIDYRDYLKKRRESAVRRLRTDIRYRLSMLGVRTSKETRQRKEWQVKSQAIFEQFAEDSRAHRYADMDFTLTQKPEPRLSFDGRYLRRALDVSYDPV